jgi:hypothetical protein
MREVAMERVFFAVPFKTFGDDHRIVAKRACEDLGLRAVFGDEERQPDALIQKLCTTISECQVGFYDITGFNPNVMIELGIGFSADRKVFLLINERKHRESPAVRAGKELIPSDLQGHERFKYQTPEDLDRELRQTLRFAFGKGRNDAYEMKQKIEMVLRRNPQPIRKIVETLGAPEQEVSDALAAMRFERRVEVEGRGGGAKWRLTRH